MIIVRLLGGLGNQMFQYATARHLSIIKKTKLKFDLSAFEKNIYAENATWRDFQLSVFKLKAEIASKQEIENVKNAHPPFIEKLKYRLFSQNIPAYRKPEQFEKQLFKFDTTLLSAPKNAYLTGYWQTPLYFNAIRSVLLKEFEFREIPVKDNYPFIDSIKKQNSVSIHIRRGDYISNPEYLKIHGLCTIDYYQRAIEYICKKVDNPTFYIFSDDMEWVKQNIQFVNNCVYVTNTPDKKDHFEMYLMSLCKHNIIANSSFSWWGAWLNQNNPSIVIAPKQWMGDPAIDTKDLIPSEWVRI